MLNARLDDFGEITALSLNTTDGTVQARCQLHGESEPIDVAVEKYSVESIDGDDWLTIGGATASRPWLAAALQRFCVDRRFRVSRRAAAALRLLA